jgi:hypothetical protein
MIYDPEILNDFMRPENQSLALRLAGRARLMVALPWEMNRMDRLLNALFAGWERTLSLDYPSLIALKGDAPADQGKQRSGQPPGIFLAAWSPPENDANGKRTREKLAALINQSWLRDAIDPRFPKLASDVPDHLRTLRRLQIKMAIEGFRSAQENRSGPKSLKDLLPGLLLTIPIDPCSGHEFTQTDLIGLMVQVREEPEKISDIPPGSPGRLLEGSR